MHILPKSKRGAALVEYVVLIALIAIISIGGIQSLGEEISDSFHETAVILDESMDAAAQPSSGGDGGDGGVNGSGGYTISPVYAEACSTGAGYIRAEGGEVVDPSNDGEWTHGLRVFTERFYVNIYFNSPNEQEYYGAYAGMDRFDQHQYGQTAIYPPGWNPCVDDQGYPPPNPA